MAFWDSWFAPRCEACGEKIVGAAPVTHDGKKVCGACVAAAAAKQAEVEARRAAEEAARAKLEGNKAFGTDPRSRR